MQTQVLSNNSNDSILIIGDLHLGIKFNSYLKNNINLHIRYSQINLEFLKENIIRYKPYKLIFLGDIFDKPIIEPMFIVMFKDFINEIKDYIEKDIILITGNHDIKSDKNNILEIFSNDKSKKVKVISKIEIDTDIDNFLYIPYYPMHKLKARLNEFIENSKYDIDKREYIIFSHLDIGYKFKFLIQPENVFNDIKENNKDNNHIEFKYKTIFNGHIHKPYVYNNTFYNIGSVANTDFSDTDIHSIALYDLNKNKIINFIANERILFFDIKDYLDIDKLVKATEKVRNLYNDNSLIFVRYNYTLEDVINELNQKYKFNALKQSYFSNDDKSNNISFSDNLNLSDIGLSFDNNDKENLNIENLFKEYMISKYGNNIFDEI